MSAEIVVKEPREYEVRFLVERVKKIDEVVKNVFVEGVHYGWVGGKGKSGDSMPRPPSLYQPGAQKFCSLFRLRPQFHTTTTRIDPAMCDGIIGHVDVVAVCTLTNADGVAVADGVGTGSTLESRYRYKSTATFEVLPDRIPDDSKERAAEYRAMGMGMKKVNERWVWVRYTGKDREPVQDPADWHNTVTKMACKRALVHAVLNATGASDIFTQDVEDMPQYTDVIDVHISEEPTVKPAVKPTQKPKPPAKKNEVFGEKGVKWLADECSKAGIEPEEVVDLMRQAHPDLPEDVAQWPRNTALHKATEAAIAHCREVKEGM